jgi:hypothetical protein
MKSEFGSIFLLLPSMDLAQACLSSFECSPYIYIPLVCIEVQAIVYSDKVGYPFFSISSVFPFTELNIELTHTKE